MPRFPGSPLVEAGLAAIESKIVKIDVPLGQKRERQYRVSPPKSLAAIGSVVKDIPVCLHRPGSKTVNPNFSRAEHEPKAVKALAYVRTVPHRDDPLGTVSQFLPAGTQGECGRAG